MLGTVMLLACSSDGSGTGSVAAATGGGASTTGGGASGSGTGGSAGSGTGGGTVDGATSDGALPPVPIDRTKTLEMLTREERGLMCDWWQGLLGGYGKMYECGGGISKSNFDNQEQCAGGGFAGCTVTVAEFEVCVQTLVPTNGCVLTRECRRFIAC